MKIGILQCDDVLVQLQPEFGNYPQMFQQLMDQVRDDLSYITYDVRLGEYPASLDECDGYVTTGSRHGVNDGLAWLNELEGFVRQLYKAGKPFVGICFGHQLLAKALGGRVERSARGWGVGVSFNEVSQVMDWMQPSQSGLDLVVSHQDQITLLPDNTQVLASSQFCPFYLIQVGQHMLGVQGHPEFSRPYSAALTDNRRDRIPASRVREAFVSLQGDVDALLATRWILNFIDQARQ